MSTLFNLPEDPENDALTDMSGVVATPRPGTHQGSGLRRLLRNTPKLFSQFGEKSTFKSKTRFAPHLTISRRLAFSELKSET